MEAILLLVIKLLGSSSIGSALGWIGGVIQRKQDIQLRKLELDHELSKMDKETAQMQLELAGKERIASIETEGKIESSRFDAIAESYKTQFSGSGKAVAFAKIIRPAATAWFIIASSGLLGTIVYLAVDAGVKFTPDQWKAWLDYSFEWFFFQAGVIIAWWFSVRSSQIPVLKR